MKDRSTVGTADFLLQSLFTGFIVVLLYNSMVFKNLPGYTTNKSKIILCIAWVLYVIFGTFVIFRKNKKYGASFCCALIPLGIYTIISYRKVLYVRIIVIMIITGVVFFLLCVSILSCKIKRRRHRKRIIKNRIIRCIYLGHYMTAIGTSVIMASIVGTIMFRGGILVSDIKAEPGNYKSATNVIQTNIDKLHGLHSEEWYQLSVQERLDVMQILANTEAQILGLPVELNVVADNLNDYTWGQYSEETHTISINADVLEKESAERLIDICCHEAYHAYQYRLIDLYRSASDEQKNFRLFGRVVQYIWEFQNYKRDTTREYYDQACEEDARLYSQEEVMMYTRALGKSRGNIE